MGAITLDSASTFVVSLPQVRHISISAVFIGSVVLDITFSLHELDDFLYLAVIGIHPCTLAAVLARGDKLNVIPAAKEFHTVRVVLLQVGNRYDVVYHSGAYIALEGTFTHVHLGGPFLAGDAKDTWSLVAIESANEIGTNVNAQVLGFGNAFALAIVAHVFAHVLFNLFLVGCLVGQNVGLVAQVSWAVTF